MKQTATITRKQVVASLAGGATPRYGEEILETLDVEGVGSAVDATSPEGDMVRVTWRAPDAYSVEVIAATGYEAQQ